jgi:ABC-type Na+ efflux pump, permease component
VTASPALPFGRLIRLAVKEQKEILRDRRTLLTLIVMPVLLYPLVGLVIQQFLAAAPRNPIYLIGVPVAEHAQLVDQLAHLGETRTSARESKNAAPELQYVIEPIDDLRGVSVDEQVSLVDVFPTVLALAGLIHRQRSSPQRCPVEASNGRLGLGGMRHFDKGKAPRAARVPIRDNLDAVDGAIRFKQSFQFFFRRRKGNRVLRNFGDCGMPWQHRWAGPWQHSWRRGYAASKNRRRKRSMLAGPNICRLSICVRST